MKWILIAAAIGVVFWLLARALHAWAEADGRREREPAALPLPPQRTASVEDQRCYDIDVISVAVPYCDAVFTGKAVRNALVRNQHEVEVFGTRMPRRPEELTDWRNALPAPRHKLRCGRPPSLS